MDLANLWGQNLFRFDFFYWRIERPHETVVNFFWIFKDIFLGKVVLLDFANFARDDFLRTTTILMIFFEFVLLLFFVFGVIGELGLVHLDLFFSFIQLLVWLQ